MNTQQIVAAISIAVAASAAMAQEVTVFETPASTASRADVRAELAQAQAAGTLTLGDQYAVEKAGVSQADRAVVRAEGRAELRASVRSHSVDTFHSI